MATNRKGRTEVDPLLKGVKDGQKYCQHCKEFKPVEDFYSVSGYCCKLCSRKRTRQWIKDHPDWAKESRTAVKKELSPIEKEALKAEYRELNMRGEEEDCEIVEDLARKYNVTRRLVHKILGEIAKKMKRCRHPGCDARFEVSRTGKEKMYLYCPIHRSPEWQNYRHKQCVDKRGRNRKLKDLKVMTPVRILMKKTGGYVNY